MHLTDFLEAYSFARRLKTLGGLALYEYTCKVLASKPERLILDLIHQMPGLNTFLRCIELPEAMADWSLISLQLKLIKIGACVVRHARAITFKPAEVAVTGPIVRHPAAIRRLRNPPSCE